MSDAEADEPVVANEEETPEEGEQTEERPKGEGARPASRGSMAKKLNGMLGSMNGMPMGMPGMMGGGGNPLLLKRQKEKEAKKKKEREEQEAAERKAKGIEEEEEESEEESEKEKKKEKEETEEEKEEKTEKKKKKEAPKTPTSTPKAKVPEPKKPAVPKTSPKSSPKSSANKVKDKEFAKSMEEAIKKEDSAEVRKLVEQVDTISDADLQQKIAEKAFSFLSGEPEEVSEKEEKKTKAPKKKEEKEEKKKTEPDSPKRKLPKPPTKVKKLPRKDYGKDEKFTSGSTLPPHEQLEKVKNTMNVMTREYSEHFLPTHEDEDIYLRELDDVETGKTKNWERPTYKAADLKERIYYSGWLRKEGGGIKSWKNRFFVVYASRIDYFEKKENKPKGTIDLSDKCSLDPTKTRPGVKYPAIELGFLNRKWHIAGETLADNRQFYSVVALRVLDAQYQRKVGQDKVCKSLVRFMQRELTDKPVPLYLNDQALDKSAVAVLCSLISRATTQQISALELRNTGIDSTLTAQILTAIAAKKTKTLTRIDFSDNPVFDSSNDGSTSPLECFQMLFFNEELFPLEHVILDNCGIGSKLLKEVASSMVPSDLRSQLKTLFLNDNKIGNSGLVHLSQILGKSQLKRGLVSLSFCGCSIGDTGCETLAGWIDNTSSIHDLLLSRNKITDEGVKTLCAPLEIDDSLKRLDLDENPFTKTGEAAKLLSYTAQKNSSLKQLKFAGLVLGAPALTAMRVLHEYGIAPMTA